MKKRQFTGDSSLIYKPLPLSFIYGMVVSISTIINGAILPGFVALATLISFLSGSLLIMMGIMGEYMWRIFDQINGFPEAVVKAGGYGETLNLQVFPKMSRSYFFGIIKV